MYLSYCGGHVALWQTEVRMGPVVWQTEVRTGPVVLLGTRHVRSLKHPRQAPGEGTCHFPYREAPAAGCGLSSSLVWILTDICEHKGARNRQLIATVSEGLSASRPAF